MMITIKQAGKHEMRRIDEEDSENWREKSMGGGGHCTLLGYNFYGKNGVISTKNWAPGSYAYAYGCRHRPLIA